MPENAARRYGNLCLSVQERRNLFNHVVQHSLMLKVLGKSSEVVSLDCLSLSDWSRAIGRDERDGNQRKLLDAAERVVRSRNIDAEVYLACHKC